MRLGLRVAFLVAVHLGLDNVRKGKRSLLLTVGALLWCRCLGDLCGEFGDGVSGEGVDDGVLVEGVEGGVLGVDEVGGLNGMITFGLG